MKITWLGQSGFFIETETIKIMIDPYLSDSVEKLNPIMKRLLPIDIHYLKLSPDVLICTHNHLDHTDPETLNILLNKEQEITVLASKNAWNTVRNLNFSQHNVIQFDIGTEITVNHSQFKAIKAVHSDDHAIGVLIQTEGKKLYISGDTLYNEKILDEIDHIDVAMVCINGYGNNMNIADAVRFSKKIGADITIPIHWGMFEKATADPNEFIKLFGMKSKILTPYKMERI